MTKSPKFNAKDLETTAAETCANGLLLSPSVPVLVLADQLVDQADSLFAAEYGRSLMVQDFARRLRVGKAKAKQSTLMPEQLSMFQHLPFRIVGKRDKRVALEHATYSDVRRYCSFLARSHRDRKDHDARLADAKRLLEVMRKAAKKRRGITLGEVLAATR